MDRRELLQLPSELFDFSALAGIFQLEVLELSFEF
jgi:hypothetical protein